MKSKQDAVAILVGALVVVGAFLFGIGIVLASSTLSAFILQLLWNFTVPAIFGLPAVGFWQMWALMILFGIIIRCVRGGKRE